MYVQYNTASCRLRGDQQASSSHNVLPREVKNNVSPQALHKGTG